MGGMGAMVEMDVGSLRLYLQNIEEYVMDEDKIVTYKWLSKNLDIHVNTAKQLLYTFATEQKDDVHLTYLVGGVLCDGTGCKIQIVRQEDLEKAKAEFKALTSEHVYSVQKARTLPDLGALYAVDVHMRDENEDDKRLSAITCSHSVLRQQEEIERLRQKARAATSAVDGKQWPTGPSVNKRAKALNNKEVATGDASKVESGSKKELKNSVIPAMFAAQTCKNMKDEKPKAAETLTAKPKASNGSSVFFSKQTEKPVKPKVSVSKDSASGLSSKDSEGNKEEVKRASKSHQEKQEDSQSKIKLSKNVKCNITKQTEKKGGKGKSINMDTNELLPAKKRKRILVISDSEDSSGDDILDRDDAEASDSSPLPEVSPQLHESNTDDVIPPTPEAELKKGRKRVRKMKDKTFMEEDGYMLTCKEYVIESCTDSEEEQTNENEKKQPEENCEPVKSDTPKSPKAVSKEPPAKKKSLRQKTKQATLTNFFKKIS
ncbi:hypothetical protein B7P43_G03826 [Cryptotermes secundus]|uniref:DNA polymerase delta subunit 3 n=1 Tax=Cryptotermes secundus TaxID=105785 RepID=A0A2J7QAG1_9NEOP|nr:DNA polymerase delta subunit 3 [Cryptotermes secundus]PNF25578.1 hypothetical protein B7P43_G03826 [Cryptotermes secundus]